MVDVLHSRVSVIIPTFNARNTLARAIESVRRQSCPIHEIIVVDDASSDGTAAFARELGDDLIVREQTTNAGPSEARNLGAQLATGEFLAFLDADDVWYADKTQAQLTVFAQDPTLGLTCTDFVRFPTEQPVPPREQLIEGFVRHEFGEVLNDPYLGTPSVMIRAEVFRQLGGFDSSLRFGEDVDLWMRVAVRHPIARLNGSFCAVSTSGSSLTSSGGEGADRGNLQVLAKFAREYPDLVTQHRRAFARASATVYTRLASARLGKGERHAARSALRDALKHDRVYGRAWYLYLRSFGPLKPTT